ncbi:TrmH family RNA methyltransferase [Prosthecomicrobium pneumaticum]|uniref:23S rRNA (Guanosine2251-2'-O)-methyltransferase n=1 Tax=Prosthecomicrobium pneumaticum TaxID=81895 RepID=A0A7W9FP96_9HYPH|nr:RNA methyltransferase [Prosthecomicrobium pneumaticum]MBB5754263.1 23S rRNA (guanosine2251-2'-O)-methyltransferase [Prosthecomicrobium pneumaticum]
MSEDDDKPARPRGGKWHGKERHVRERYGHGLKRERPAEADRPRPRTPGDRRPDQLFLYGIHPVAAALANPRRKILRLAATKNALDRLVEEGAPLPDSVEETNPRALDKLLGSEAVHQGVAAEVAPLDPIGLADLGEARLVVVLDQLTDPHNVGAILRSAVALGADAIVSTWRHAPVETGVLAKAASGALEMIAWVEVQNLARALDELGERGFTRVGLDSEGGVPIEAAFGDAGRRIALVLGAEGKGLRKLTRETCDVVARLDMPGPIKSLNVSNAAALALYLARRHLG